MIYCRYNTVFTKLTLHLRKIVLRLFIAALIPSLIVACSSDSDDVLDTFDKVPTIAPIESVVKTAIPLSYASTIAMASVNGTVFSNVSLSNTCNSYPCAASLVITVQPNTLPVELDGISDNGEIVVVGLWSSASQAILTVIFDDINGGNDFLSVRKVSTIPVTQSGNVTTVVYSNFDIDVASESEVNIDLNDMEIQQEYNRLTQTIDTDPALNIALDAWVVETNNAGTTIDFSDDEYRIVGGGQYFDTNANEISVLQMGVIDLLVTPDCAINPIGGSTVLQEVRVSSGTRASWPVLGQALIEFRTNCDGTARVILGTGSFFLASGDDIDLGFDN